MDWPLRRGQCHTCYPDIGSGFRNGAPGLSCKFTIPCNFLTRILLSREAKLYEANKGMNVVVGCIYFRRAFIDCRH